MPDERPQIPPPRYPVREYTTPNFADGFFTEVFKITDPAYLKIQTPKRGTLYSTIQGANQNVITLFPNLYFLKEARLGNSHEFVIWFWASDTNADDTYNATVDYMNAVLGYPEYTRPYDIRRDAYDADPTPLAIGATLRTLIGAVVTAGGTGYTDATTLAFSGGGGSGATAVPIIASGVIRSVIITNSGSGYTSAPTLTATDTAGTGATFSVLLQATTAILVDQKKAEFPDDHPLRNEYVRVVRYFKTLPGPVVTSVKIYGNTGMPMLVSRQEIATPTMPNYQAGEFKPAAINVQSIGTGSTPTVALASDIGLAAGAWVTFVGTTTTPSMTTAPLQIVSVGTNSIQVSVPSPITAGQAGAGGTVQSTNYVTREFEETPNANIKIKVDTTLFIPDPSVYNQVAKGDEQYPFPGYLRSIVFYRSKALTAVSPASPSPSSSFSYGGQPLFDIQPGYRGPCPAYILTFFFSGPPPDSFAALYPPTIIIPASGTDAVQGGSVATKGLPTLFDMISISGQWTGHFTGEFLTGPTPNNYTTIDPSANAMAVNSISSGDASGTPNYPVVEVNVNHGLTAGMFIELDGTAYDGTYQILGVPALNQVTIAQTTTSQGPGGTMSLTANTQFGSQEASLEINLAVSSPPKIVGILNLVSISGGSTPTVTANSAHYLKSGNWVLLATTNTSPSVDGRWQITVTGSTTFTITPPSSITGSTGHGTMQNIITVVGKPQKLTVANLWQVDVVQILVPYTSGEYP